VAQVRANGRYLDPSTRCWRTDISMVSRSEIDTFVAARGEPQLTLFHQLLIAPSHAMLDVTTLTPWFMYSRDLCYCLLLICFCFVTHWISPRGQRGLVLARRICSLHVVSFCPDSAPAVTDSHLPLRSNYLARAIRTRWRAGHVVSGLTSRHARKGKGRCSSTVRSLDKQPKA
jgi:hypothetical protein